MSNISKTIKAIFWLPGYASGLIQNWYMNRKLVKMQREIAKYRAESFKREANENPATDKKP